MMMMTDAKVLEKLEESTCDATRQQEEALRSIIERHGGVRYLRCCVRGYDASLQVTNFRTVVPLSTYEDYSDHINRLADGPLHHNHNHDHDQDHDPDHDRPLLSVDPLRCFFYSSGTGSMKPKLIPYFESSLSKAASFMAQHGSSALLRRLFPPRSSVNKVIPFIYARNVKTTKGGFDVMAASSFPLLSSNASSPMFASSSSPRDVIIGGDIDSQMYCHLLCGLRNSDSIDGIRAPFASGLIAAFSLLESKWEQMCEDLETGLPSGEEIPSATMRTSVAAVLGGPRADLAERIRAICREKSWVGIVAKLWPNLRYVRCVATGSMRQYYPKLKYYAGETTTMLGGDYIASECCVAINLDPKQPPETTRYVMLPNAAYFEFLPFDPDQIHTDRKETVDFSGVEIGKMYEVVVTTYRGLYRYRLGDIVRVVGYHNSSPQVEFVTRAPGSLTDIITERDLMYAAESCRPTMRTEVGTELTEFASFLDLESSPKRLKVVVEVEDECTFAVEESVVALRRICSLLESNLGSLYKVKRDNGEVGCLSMTVVRRGSFDAFSHVAAKKGIPVSQYKPPKIIRNREIVSFLESYSLLIVCSEEDSR